MERTASLCRREPRREERYVGIRLSEGAARLTVLSDGSRLPLADPASG